MWLNFNATNLVHAKDCSTARLPNSLLHFGIVGVKGESYYKIFTSTIWCFGLRMTHLLFFQEGT